MWLINRWNTPNPAPYKVIVVVALMICTFESKSQQRWAERNNPSYDDRKLTYGFLIGIHSFWVTE